MSSENALPLSQCRVVVTSLSRLLCLLCGLFAGTASAFQVTPTPQEPPQEIIDAVDSSVEANTMTGVSTLSNGDPFTWIAEDSSVLAINEAIRYRLYTYQFSEDVDSCGVYGIRASIVITANGPDIGVNDNVFLAILDADEGAAAQSYQSPASIGASTVLEQTIGSSAAGLAGGVYIAYGATTFQRPDISSGYTFSAPTVEVLTDLSSCPAAPVPALGSLQLVLLSFSLSILSVLYLRRRK